MFTILNQEQAMEAVKSACNHILTDDLSVEGKLLMFDSFSQSVVMWVSAGLIEYGWLDSMLDYILDIREIYRQEIRRQSVKKVRR